jgi:hypothetical protein
VEEVAGKVLAGQSRGRGGVWLYNRRAVGANRRGSRHASWVNSSMQKIVGKMGEGTRRRERVVLW